MVDYTSVDLIIAIASLVVWIYMLVGRQGFWLCREFLLTQASPSDSEKAWPEIVAIVPARNEADLIERSLLSLLHQVYHGPLGIVVVDDQSSDGTGDLVRRMAFLNPEIPASRARTVSVVSGGPVPHGWTGKLSALQQGLALAPERAEYLLFVDADIELAPQVLRGLVEVARAKGALLASVMVKLRCESRAERWLVPAFVFFFQMLYPFPWVNDRRRRTAAAAGGCMLVRRTALAESGGLSALRGSIIDDCALGAQMKKRGPIWLGLSRDAVSLRAYPTFATFGKMVARSAFAELRFSPYRLLAALVGMSLVFLAPPLLVLFAQGPARLLGAVAWLTMAIAFAPTLRLYELPVWGGVSLPAIAAAYVLFTIQSAAQFWRGQGGFWKDRIQAPSPKVERT